MTHILWQTGHPGEARSFGQSALAIARDLGDFPLEVAAHYFVGHSCYASGDYRGAEKLCREIVQSLGANPGHELRFGLLEFPAVSARSFLACSLAEVGAFDEGITYGTDGLRIAEALDYPYTLIYADWALGQVYCLKGEIAHAARLLERSVALARNSNITLQSAIMTGFLGHAYASSGRVEEGLSLLQQALAALEPLGWRTFHSRIVVNLGEACLLANRMEDALTAAGQALTRAREGGQRGVEAYALRLLGEIGSHDRSSDAEAEEHYSQALALADQLGMRPLVAHCHFGLGKLHWRTGKSQQAHERLTTATTMYREMGMTYWLEQAEKEMRELT